jgi:hypothetical protein
MVLKKDARILAYRNALETGYILQFADFGNVALKFRQIRFFGQILTQIDRWLMSK